MDTTCEQVESDCCVKNSGTDVSTIAVNIGSESMECSSISDTDKCTFCLTQHWPVRMVLPSMMYLMMVIVCLVLYHIS